jgi:apolipoprotein D and lipocalin family protein
MAKANKRMISGLIAVIFTTGCAHTPPTIPPVAKVDLQRFMGDWYVIANIPSYPEREAYNAVESYELKNDGRIMTTFRYRKGSFDAPVKMMHPVGHVVPGTSNAVWDMQVYWPIKAEYVIVGLNDDYSQTIIGRSKRDYAWVMSRTPTISQHDYDAAVAKLKALGYKLDDLRKVPQQWPEAKS